MIIKKSSIKNLTLCSIFTVLIVMCTYIQIPFTIPFTMQTFAIALCCFVLGSKKALFCVITYILLGIIGFPVFSGFGSAGVLFGPTGGFIFGFVIMVICQMILEKVFPNLSKNHPVMCLIISLVTCYIFGVIWYTKFSFTTQNTSFLQVLKICILPFIIPDILKLFLANKVAKTIMSHLAHNPFDNI